MRPSLRRSMLPLATLLWTTGTLAASFPPGLRFRTIETAQVIVHFHQGLEATAREAAALATEILDRHESRYGVEVRPVHLVIADTSDSPNGFATPLFYPLVHIRAVGPDGSDEFGNHDGWLRLVLTHELAHIVHLEQARGVPGFGRHVFGRAPFLFPNSLTPGWLVEGLASFEETEGTAFGRGRNPDWRMVRRMAALSGRFPAEDRGAIGLDAWPGGQSAYIYGEGFVRDLTSRFGDRVLPEIARVHAGRVIPYADDWTGHTVTGASFHERWREWRRELTRSAEVEAAAIRGDRPLTEARALTARGIRQVGPRYSPDGAWVAYTSRTLTRYGEIRLIHPDGSGDRRVTRRNGGSTLAWTADGRALVYDQPEVFRTYAVFSDLRTVDVASGRTVRLTRGLRARDPDVSRSGRVVFVRELGGRSEIEEIGLDGSARRALTRSEPDTEWSHPRWSPEGDRIAASRWTRGGFLDIVLVDPATGAVSELTHDRAKDVEPTWTPDGRHVVFRSDRDGVSNLHALRVSDGALFAVSHVLGGAFEPDVAPDGRHVVFAGYGPEGYDVQTAPFDPTVPAAPFVDPYPPSRPDPTPVTAEDRPYRPWPTLLPRFWSPYAVGVWSGELQTGVVTAGFDPLFRHAYGLDLHYGHDTERLGLRGYYQYDRFRPTFVLSVEDTSDPAQAHGYFRTQEVNVRAAIPIVRSYRLSQSASLGYRRRRETSGTPGAPGKTLDLGALEAVWNLSSTRQFPYSVSPVEGFRLRLAYAREEPAFGSDVALGKATADLRVYTRMFGASDTLAVRLGGGATFGQPGFLPSYAIGGFPDASLLDVVRTNPAVLRGYEDNAFRGRSLVYGNAEYRVPLAHPQRGVRSYPIFLRHIHATAFFDAAEVWNDAFRLGTVKKSAGAALGADWTTFHRLPLTTLVGLARGLDAEGTTQAYFRLGLSF
jgi:Tol biopolymer transport system component